MYHFENGKVATTKNICFNYMEVVLNKKRGRNDLFLIWAPLTDERCNYNAMIEYVTIRKLKG